MNKSRLALVFDKTNTWIRPFFDDLNPKNFDISFAVDLNDVVGYDIVILLGYTKLVSKEFLLKNKLTLVVHESDLPKGKGFAPVQWQILEGAELIPICLLEVAEGADEGAVVLKSDFFVPKTSLYKEIREAQGKASRELVEQFLKIYPDHSFLKQSGVSSTYLRRTKKDSRLDVKRSIEDQFNLMRISNNQDWPCFFEMYGETYTLQITKKDDS